MMEQDSTETKYVLAWVDSRDRLEFDRHYPDGSPLQFDSEAEAVKAIPPKATRLVLKSVTRHRAE